MVRHNAEWVDIGGMNFRTFSENKQEILAALNVIMDNPKSRNRFRLLAVYVRETGELLAEVFKTNLGPLLVGRSGTIHSTGDVEFVRQDRGSANLVVGPLDSDPDGAWRFIGSSGGQVTLWNRDLRRWIVEGKRHTVSLHNAP
jgi:hypothetical protein